MSGNLEHGDIKPRDIRQDAALQHGLPEHPEDDITSLSPDVRRETILRFAESTLSRKEGDPPQDAWWQTALHLAPEIRKHPGRVLEVAHGNHPVMFHLHKLLYDPDAPETTTIPMQGIEIHENHMIMPRHTLATDPDLQGADITFDLGDARKLVPDEATDATSSNSVLEPGTFPKAHFRYGIAMFVGHHEDEEGRRRMVEQLVEVTEPGGADAWASRGIAHFKKQWAAVNLIAYHTGAYQVDPFYADFDTAAARKLLKKYGKIEKTITQKERMIFDVNLDNPEDLGEPWEFWKLGVAQLFRTLRDRISGTIPPSGELNELLDTYCKAAFLLEAHRRKVQEGRAYFADTISQTVDILRLPG